MVTTVAAGPPHIASTETAVSGSPRPSVTPAVHAGRVIRHGMMAAGMIPCVIGGTRTQHACALILLLMLTAWLAVRARHHPGRQAELVDSLAMCMLTVVSVLAAHGGGATHGHSLVSIDISSILFFVTAVGWVGLRCSVDPPQRSGSTRMRTRSMWSLAMVAVMGALAFYHSGAG